MNLQRGFARPPDPRGCALTIGNFDGVHLGHQAMLARLIAEARQRKLPSCVLSFEPHPRDHFARIAGRVDAAPARISTLRDKLAELQRCGIDRVVLAPFNDRFAAQSPQAFIDQVLLRGLDARFVLVGDDFSFGARRAGNYALLEAAGQVQGFEVAQLGSVAVQGLRVSSSAVRDALAAGDMARVQALLGRPYAVSGRVQHGRKLGRGLGFRTLNLHFDHARPAATGIFVARVEGLAAQALPAVASMGVRPSVEDAGQVRLEVHCLQWPDELGPDAGYGRCVRVELLHHLHGEVKYPSLEALQAGIAADVAQARRWFAT